MMSVVDRARGDVVLLRLLPEAMLRGMRGDRRAGGVDGRRASSREVSSRSHAGNSNRNPVANSLNPATNNRSEEEEEEGNKTTKTTKTTPKTPKACTPPAPRAKPTSRPTKTCSTARRAGGYGTA